MQDDTTENGPFYVYVKATNLLLAGDHPGIAYAAEFRLVAHAFAGKAGLKLGDYVIVTWRELVDLMTPGHR